MKTIVVIAIAALSAAIGESLLSYGMRRYGIINLAEPSHILVLISSVVRNPYIFIGAAFLAVFFFLYLAALSWADLSFVLPLTAMSYIFAALIAKFFLEEDVSWLRWAGTVIIVIGIVFVAADNRPRSIDDDLGNSLRVNKIKSCLARSPQRTRRKSLGLDFKPK